MTTVRLYGIKEGSLVDGPGVRMTFFFSGCLHHCYKCHNPDTQDFKNYESYGVTQLIDKLVDNMDLIDGLTISGGDALFQYYPLVELLYRIRHHRKLKKLNIWLYTGFLFEQLDDTIKKLVDVIVDGRYTHGLSKKQWAGSSNQRIFKKQSDGVWNLEGKDEMTCYYPNGGLWDFVEHEENKNKKLNEFIGEK